MAMTAGVVSQNSVSSNTATVSSTAPTGGVGTMTQQWYRDTTSGFTPGAGNIVSGATDRTLEDSGLIPNTTYFYKAVYTDEDTPTPATATSNELTVVTGAVLPDQNQFEQSTVLGQLDQRYSNNTTPVMIHSSQTTPLYPGSWVKVVDTSDGVPQVVGCSAVADDAAGVLNYDIKSAAFNAGDRAEMSEGGNVVYLMPTVSGSRWQRYQMDLATVAGVKPITPSNGASIVALSFDKPVAGTPSRFRILPTPAFEKA